MKMLPAVTSNGFTWTPGERRALLAYARWWFGSHEAWEPRVSRGWRLVSDVVDGGRARVAESLAYDNTNGPESEDDDDE